MTNKIVVLVVEDEALIRLGTLQMLEDAGFEAVEAVNADEALKLLESRDDILVVFTDVNMPGSVDGLRMAHTIRGRWPPVHLIVTSGLLSPKIEDLPSRGRFVRKPYEFENVLATIQELLDSTTPSNPDGDVSSDLK